MFIQQTNTENAIYHPDHPLYWDVQSLNQELLRTFDICHGCRMCFNYCESFPALFKALDSYANGDVSKISEEDKTKIIDECFHCKLCYVNCPYTDKDQHAFNLNFPALMQRAVHIRAKKKGIPFRDKILQNSDLAGRLNTGIISKVVNYSFRTTFHRTIIEKILGIHKNKLMPEFHKTSFAKWFRRHQKNKKSSEDTKVILFSTCFVNYNHPAIGKDAVFVLEKNRCDVLYPPQNCCGMPGINTGDLKFALKKIRSNIESLYPYAEKKIPILVINPTCSMTLKQEYPLYAPLLGKTKQEKKEWEQKAKIVSEMTKDIHEFLMELKRENRFNQNFLSTPGSVAYHAPCHLRAQWKGFPSRDLMKLIPGNTISFVAECSGHDGTWSMKKEHFETSLKCGQKAFEQLKQKNANYITSDCPLAAMQLKQGMNLEYLPMHPIEVLAKSYRSPEDGGFLEIPQKNQQEEL